MTGRDNAERSDEEERRTFNRELDGRVALITGAGAGIGEAIARRFAEEGAKVVVAERDERTGRDVADAVGGLFTHVDVAVREQVENAVAQAISVYGSIDVTRWRGRAAPGGTSGSDAPVAS
jgi:NAD(P)-dependent dehydrogenase (short-subunit alcohol dehydrogenase family)